VEFEGGQSSETGPGGEPSRRPVPRSARAARLGARVRAAVLLGVVAGTLAAWAASAQAAVVHPYQSQLTAPTAKGVVPWFGLCGMGIDPGTGEIYLAGAEVETKEEGFPAVEVLLPTGEFVGSIRAKGEGFEYFEEACSTAVNDANGQIYVANAGTGEGETLEEKDAVFVYANAGGGKYTFKPKLTLDGSNTPERTFEASPEGVPEAGQPLYVAVAQKNEQPNSEDVYVGDDGQGVVDRFGPKGEYLGQLPVSAGTEGIAAITTDSVGDVFVAVTIGDAKAEGEALIDEFSPSGQLINQITGTAAGGFGGQNGVSGMAVDASGHLYVSSRIKRVVDEFDSAGRFMGQITEAGSPTHHFTEPAGVGINLQTNDVYVIDNRSDGSVVDVFGPGQASGHFLESQGVSDVSATSATLEAEINPSGSEATYRFEYAREGGSSTELAPVNIGAGESVQRVEAQLQGLSANTVYEFRVVVEAGGTTEEGSGRFRTETEGATLTLPDHRAWELVSPPNKFGALIKGIGASGVVQAAADGSRIAYSATSPLELEVQANAGESPALSVRGEKKWETHEIMPPDYVPTGPLPTGTVGLENRAYSSDLSRSLVNPFMETPPLSPEASERGPYLRDLNDVECDIEKTTCYTPLVTAKGELADDTTGIGFGGLPLGREIFGLVQIIGATPDDSHAVLTSAVPLNGETHASGIYEWSAARPPAERLQLVNVLPDGQPLEPTNESSFAYLGYTNQGSEMVRHAISDDGSRIVWGAEHHLYLRDMTKRETIQLDVPNAELGSAVYQTASSDAKKIFFTDQQKLTGDSTAAKGRPDLYVCEVGEAEGKLTCELHDLTVGASEESDANVRGLALEASEDGSYIYFVAAGVLGSGENSRGEKAVQSECTGLPPVGATCNLYVAHYNGTAWEAPTFIAGLSKEDGPDWGAQSTGLLTNAVRLENLTSRVSPNGLYAAFMSDRSLTGYDNTDASPSAGGAADEEVFLYSASTNSLTCASCNPSGQRPHGKFDRANVQHESLVDRASFNWKERWLAANVPGWTSVAHAGLHASSLHQARYLSNSGRLFFDGADALVPQDTNSTEDVYEFEPAGVGTCALAAGCVSLISSGEAKEESAFLDASETGGDAFFLTIGKLVPDDVDGSYDIYDAHDCSESPCITVTPPPPLCSSSGSCQGMPPAAPAFGTPASSSPSGSGNLAPPPAQAALPSKVVKLTNAQKLAKALKACKKLKRKKKRQSCERSARKRYGPKHKAKHKAKHAKKSSTRSGGSHR
jgi:DNA-binding beta-propeller fold protein YncE